jgi:methylmalonyl-CoA/ethylmalonyl-CoA epimerase
VSATATPPHRFGRLFQVAYVVTDLDASLRHWTQRVGVGPWTVMRDHQLVGELRGEPTTVTIDVGLGFHDGMQIELIQPTSRTPSPYQDDDGRPLRGPHHVAMFSTDIAADIDRAVGQGLDLTFRATSQAASPVRLAYLQSADEPDWRLELIEADVEVFENYLATAAASAKAWDGVTDPVTELTD